LLDSFIIILIIYLFKNLKNNDTEMLRKERSKNLIIGDVISLIDANGFNDD